MRKRCLPLLILLAGAAAITGCSKNETSLTGNIENAVADLPLTVPYLPEYTPKPGIEPEGPYVDYPWQRDESVTPVDEPFTVISNPVNEYIQQTCLFDISHLEVGSTYNKIKDNNIQLTFFSSEALSGTTVRRLLPETAVPFGWNAHWNYSPYIEDEHPEVLFTQNFTHDFLIVLSKPCIAFGVEMSPNTQDREFMFSMAAGDHAFDSSKGYTRQYIQTPSGAKLYAIKATKPFTVISIVFDIESSANLEFSPDGIALANIRYGLDE